MIGKINANKAIIALITIIAAESPRFFNLFSNAFTNGFNAAAKTNDANKIMSKLKIFGININKHTAKMIKIIVFVLKSFLNMINIPNLNVNL
jgi:hypothetical protein